MVSCLTSDFSAIYTLVMVLAKANVIARKCNTTTTASLTMWKKAIWTVPTPWYVSKIDPKALKVGSIVLKPYRWPAITKALLLVIESDSNHVTILSGNIAHINTIMMKRSKTFQRSLSRRKKKGVMIAWFYHPLSKYICLLDYFLKLKVKA